MKIRMPLVAAFLVVGVIDLNAATIPVTSTADSGAGSLRSALAGAANGDTIDASGVSGTILLTSGELLVTKNVTILGPGPANLAVNGNFPHVTNRVFHTTNAVTAVISGLTITNGHTVPLIFPANAGGGIYNDQSTLTLSNCIFTHNVASGSGGGILNSATLTVSNCTFKGNITGNGFAGGAILNIGATARLTVIATTFTGNNSARGGAIGNDESTLTLSNCTLSGNSATDSGGAIYSEDGGTLTVVATTLSGNSAQQNGGGIYNVVGSTLTIVNSTLSGNSAGSGGGIFNDGESTLEIGSTILNTDAPGGNIFNDSGTVTSDGYNLSSDDGSGYLTATGDQINTDPLLGPLQDNGGPTYTHALLPGSPAIDKGKNFSGSATDQRGQPRLFDDPDIANASGGDGTDIGAYEVINLRITAMQKASNDLHLSFTSGAGGKYVVESRTDLLTGAWGPFPGTNTGTGVIVQLVETNALTVSQQFYRVHQLP